MMSFGQNKSEILICNGYSPESDNDKFSSDYQKTDRSKLDYNLINLKPIPMPKPLRMHSYEQERIQVSKQRSEQDEILLRTFSPNSIVEIVHSLNEFNEMHDSDLILIPSYILEAILKERERVQQCVYHQKQQIDELQLQLK